MKITVFGAGSIGTLLGGLLARVHDVTLVGRAPHMQAIHDHGLRIEAPKTETRRVTTATDAEHLPPAELLLLSVKAYDTQTALQAVRPIMGASTCLLGLQNGLGNWEQALQAYPRNPVLAAAVMYGAFTPRPGTVAWNGVGEITLGGRVSDAAASERVRQAFDQADIAVRTTANIAGALWLKTIVNAAINPLTAIHRVPNGALLEDPRLRTELQEIAREAARVARAEGIQLPVADPVAEVERVAQMTRSNRSSMLQSVEKGLPIELEAITGAVLAAARRHAIPCPRNQALYEAMTRLGLRTLR